MADDPTELPQESVIRRLGASGRPAPQLRLEGDDDSPVAHPSREEAIPLRVTSRYQVAGEIARGGVGVVLRGRDADLGREVALKVLREDHAESVDLLRRFVEEAQVGGQLQHPGIVPVYEIGLQPDGRPFFAMKLVKGGTLAKALAARKHPDEDRRRFLSVFEQVCLTMAYVHSRGVVHRDLKPSNVMIGSFGEVQVVDWGFGKVLSHGGVADERRAKREMREMKGATVVHTVRSGSSGSDSLAGSVMGTPAYMPPEQALGQIDRVDERSDVFALGAILCEILTGKPPYTGDDLLGQARRCRLDDAHARLADCGADDELVKLTVACLAPLPKDRPKNAAAVAGTVTTYLAQVDERAHESRLAALDAKAKADQAREAAQESRDEAAARVRARRQTLAGAAVVLVALIGGGVAWTSSAAQRAARDRALTAAAAEAVQDATRLVAAKDWAPALAAAQRAGELAAAEGVDPSLAEKSKALVEQVGAGQAAAAAEAAAAATDAALLVRVDSVRERLRENLSPRRQDAEFAAAFREYGLDVDAVETAAASARLQTRGAAFALRVAGALDEWAFLRRADARLATPGAPRLSALARQLDPDETRNRVREAAAAGDVSRLQALASELGRPTTPAATVVLLAQALTCAGDRAAADPLLRGAFFPHPDDYWVEYSLACSLAGLGDDGGNAAVRHATAASALRPDSIGAVATRARAQALARRPDPAVALLNDTIPRAPQDARLRAALSLALRAKGDFAGSVAAAREALRLEPGETRRRIELVAALVAAGDPDAALAEARGAAQAAPDSVPAAECVASTLFGRGDVAEAVVAWQAVVRLDPRGAAAHTGLGRAFAAKGDADAATKELQAAIALDHHAAPAFAALAALQRDAAKDYKAAAKSCVEAIGRGDDATRAWAQDELGHVCLAQDDLDGAQNAFEAALRVRPDDARGRAGLGAVLHARGRHDLAVVELRAALAKFDEDERRKLPVTASRSTFGHARLQERVRVHLAVALRATKRFDEAEAELRRAIDADKQSWTARHELGVTLLAKGAPRDAVEPLRDAVRMNPDSAVARDDHGRAYLAADRADEALAEFRKAVELDASLTVAHRHLGELLLARCDFAGAKDELDSWKTDEPDDPACRRALAQALLGVGEVDAATTEFRAALHLDPDDPGTLLLLHGQLELTGACDDALAVVAETAKWNPKSPQILACHGFALMQRGRLDEALTQLRAAQGGGATTPGSWPRAADAAQWLARAERLAAADRDPNSVTDAQDRLGLAQWNASRGMFDAAVNLYRAAFAASPKLADDVAAGHRAAAARAALGAVAQAKPPAAATMRKSALEWLRADLAPLRAGLGGKDARTAADARAHLAAWRVDPRFASVRDDAESSKLPASEADEWRTFWRDVEVALASPVAN